jgi:hypothetical protein
MLQSGIQPNCICDHLLVTVLFAYLMDFTSFSVHLDTARIIECLDEVINTFNKIDDNYDVFKVKTKPDSSYMIVASLKDRSHMDSSERKSSTVKIVFI